MFLLLASLAWGIKGTEGGDGTGRQRKSSRPSRRRRRRWLKTKKEERGDVVVVVVIVSFSLSLVSLTSRQPPRTRRAPRTQSSRRASFIGWKGMEREAVGKEQGDESLLIARAEICFLFFFLRSLFVCRRKTSPLSPSTKYKTHTSTSSSSSSSFFFRGSRFPEVGISRSLEQRRDNRYGKVPAQQSQARRASREAVSFFSEFCVFSPLKLQEEAAATAAARRVEPHLHEGIILLSSGPFQDQTASEAFY